MLRVVVDTNVVFEGLTHLGASAKVIDAWAARRFRPCVSTALSFEYQDVLARKLGLLRAEAARMALQALLVRCEYVPIYFSYRPASRDPGDDFIVDCVLNSRSLLVTNNVRDFSAASRGFGFSILRPERFLSILDKEVQP